MKSGCHQNVAAPVAPAVALPYVADPSHAPPPAAAPSHAMMAVALIALHFATGSAWQEGTWQGEMAVAPQVALVL